MSASRVLMAPQAAGRKRLLWAGAGVLTAAVLAWALMGRPHGSAGSGDAARPAAEGARFPWSTGSRPDVFANLTEQITAFQSSQPTEQQIQSELKQAAEEMVRQLGRGPLPGPITERPAFASRLEWLALLQAAAQSPDRQAELTRLINELRFFKQLDLWRSNNPVALTPAQRQTVAAALLDEIPDRVARGVMAVAEARSLQQAMVNDVLSDPAQRPERLAREAARLKPPAAPAPATGTAAAPAAASN